MYSRKEIMQVRSTRIEKMAPYIFQSHPSLWKIELIHVWVDIIVPRGIENHVAIDMVVKHIQRILAEKSRKHQAQLKRLGDEVEDEPLSENVIVLKPTRQVRGIITIILETSEGNDLIFYCDRLASLLVER